MSGLLRSRAKMEREPRTAQFEIQQPCPTAQPGPHNPKRIAALPMMVWVEVPAVPVIDYPCKGPVYRVVPKSVTEAKKKGVPPLHPARKDNVFVCEHMGRIIE